MTMTLQKTNKTPPSVFRSQLCVPSSVDLYLTCWPQKCPILELQKPDQSKVSSKECSMKEDVRDLQPQIQYHRSLDTRIYKADIQFWAVLGSQGCRERKKS